MGNDRSGAISRIALILSMGIFGTIGLFRRYIPLPSGSIAFFRGLIGTLALVLIALLLRKKPDINAIKKRIVPLCVSGALIGFNWILLFEAYNYTSVSTATLCYYMAPILVIIASPIFLRERLRAKQIICTLVAIAGMVLVSGVLRGGDVDVRGILLGLGAAALYASVILINRRLGGMSAYDKTIVQLGAATVVILPYTLIAEDISAVIFTPKVILLLLLVGIVHTGISYAMYFGSVGALPTQTVAVFSYIDPVVAIILSALILKEPMGVLEAIGAVMILGAAVMSEISLKKVNAHECVSDEKQ